MDTNDKLKEVKNINNRLKKAGEVIKEYIDKEDTKENVEIDIKGQLNILDFL